jgi:hypothetical protein
MILSISFITSCLLRSAIVDGLDLQGDVSSVTLSS